MRSEEAVSRRVRVRQAADAFVRRADAVADRVPTPVLRVLATLPWLLRRLPVPFWVPVLLLVLRRLARRRARKLNQPPRT